MATTVQQHHIQHTSHSNWLKPLFQLLLSWQQRAQLRKHLQTLDAHMLKDIGLSQADVYTESNKPFWRG